MKKPLVAVVLGSDSDYPVIQDIMQILSDFRIPYEITVSSAHRSVACRTFSGEASTNTPTLATNGGSLWIIIAHNKEDIEVTAVSAGALA